MSARRRSRGFAVAVLIVALALIAPSQALATIAPASGPDAAALLAETSIRGAGGAQFPASLALQALIAAAIAALWLRGRGADGE